MDKKLQELYSTKPILVADILNIHFFNPYTYHTYYMEHSIQHLSISRDLMICIEFLKEVESYTRDFGRFELVNSCSPFIPSRTKSVFSSAHFNAS